MMNGETFGKMAMCYTGKFNVHVGMSRILWLWTVALSFLRMKKDDR